MNNKIFWAFNPFEDDFKTDVFVAETLAFLNKKLKAEIHPVFALGSIDIDAGPEFTSLTTEGISKVTNEKMDALVKVVSIPGILKPQIVVDHSISNSRLVKSFINFAEKNGANLIVVGSHGKKGVDRAVVGSFAESLLMQCHLPVLVVGKHFDQIPKMTEILFPTDFSDDSSYAFHKAIDLAKEISAKLTLFHHLSPLLDPVVQSALAPFGGVWTSYKGEMEGLFKRKSKMLEEWTEKAKKEKIEVKSFLDTGLTDSSEAILSYANLNKIGIIAMAAQSGPVATTLFGAITRKVVRQACCPVWLLRRH